MLRTKINKDIICDFVPPARASSHVRVIIYCMGFPSNPFKERLAKYYSKKGYWFFVPRYRGCWESDGELLKEEPTKDIKEVIDAVFNGFTDIPYSAINKPKNYKLKTKNLTLLGVSFGGPAALLLSADPRVSRVVCFAPVIDWTVESRVERGEWFWPFVKEAYGQAFRINLVGVKKLYKGKFYNPIRQLDKIASSKILIMHAKDDPIVDYSTSLKFAKITGTKLVSFKKGGHFGTNFLMKSSICKKVLNWIDRSK